MPLMPGLSSNRPRNGPEMAPPAPAPPGLHWPAGQGSAYRPPGAHQEPGHTRSRPAPRQAILGHPGAFPGLSLLRILPHFQPGYRLADRRGTEGKASYLPYRFGSYTVLFAS